MISFQQVTYTYPGGTGPILRNVNLQIPPGKLALVTGPSGAGKSTLLRCINGLVPHFSGGILKGQIEVAGLDPVQASPQQISGSVGFVFQDPESQFVLDSVEDEIAFALENAAIPPAEMHTRVAEMLEYLGLTHLRSRILDTLSGGEQQRVAIAAALALRPSILVLDEPTSQLDPEAAEEVLLALERLQRLQGLTVVLAEHRLERILPFADLLVHVEDQQVISGPPRQVLAQISLNPPLVRLGKTLGWEPLPLTIEESLPFVAKMTFGPTAQAGNPLSETCPTVPVLQAEGLDFSYGPEIILQDASLELSGGEILGLMGSNGAGKSTLLRCLVGLLRPSRGMVKLYGKDTASLDVADICLQIGYLPQDPNVLLFADSVLEELKITLRNHHLPVREDFLMEFLGRIGLAGLSGQYPRDLSVGERQRVALGAVTISLPKVVLLDEPTRGLDYASKAALLKILLEWREAGKAILLVTHDVEFAAMVCDRVAIMEKGQIVHTGKTARVLRGTRLFTPQIAQLFPDTDWLTARDVLLACGKDG
ncbi:MAG: ATP-binding cassette domain-containing protein [Anaerolineales bacterium]